MPAFNQLSKPASASPKSGVVMDTPEKPKRAASARNDSINDLSATKPITRLLPTAHDTDTCGADLARSLHILASGLVVTFEGELGAGKTAIVRAALRSCGVTGAIKSPTYAIVESYPVGARIVHHMDFYRLEHPLAWQEAGLAECFEANAAVLIEWPSKAFGLPIADIAVQIDIDHDGTRRLHATAQTPAGSSALHAWMGA
jgi:tRNA threonylcarbamoyladenosine biosynthesis protein TsaE